MKAHIKELLSKKPVFAHTAKQDYVLPSDISQDYLHLQLSIDGNRVMYLFDAMLTMPARNTTTEV